MKESGILKIEGQAGGTLKTVLATTRQRCAGKSSIGQGFFLLIWQRSSRATHRADAVTVSAPSFAAHHAAGGETRVDKLPCRKPGRAFPEWKAAIAFFVRLRPLDSTCKINQTAPQTPLASGHESFAIAAIESTGVSMSGLSIARIKQFFSLLVHLTIGSVHSWAAES